MKSEPQVFCQEKLPKRGQAGKANLEIVQIVSRSKDAGHYKIDCIGRQDSIASFLALYAKYLKRLTILTAYLLL